MSEVPRDQIVARWVDDGPEVAPDRFVWAALDQVERTPQRGSWRARLENTPMLLKFALPAWGAAAVIILAIFAIGRLNPAPSGIPTESATAVPSPQASPDPCDRQAVEVSTSGTLDVMWCVQRGASRVVIPFTIQAPEAWADEVDTGGGALYFRPLGEPGIVFALTGPQQLDEWVAAIEGNPVFSVTERETATVAGGEATALTVRPLEPEADATPLIGGSTPLYLAQGRTARVWILEGQGEAVAVGTATGGEVFPAWARQIDDVVQSLEWGSTP